MSNNTNDVSSTTSGFNLNDLRLSTEALKPDKGDALSDSVAVRKPEKHEYFRVLSGEQNRLTTLALMDKVNKDTYMVAPNLRTILEDDLQMVVFVVVINREGKVFIWPVKHPTNGVDYEWWESEREAASKGEDRWVRMMADIGIGRYKIKEATGNLPEPIWPESSFEKLLKEAFENRYIQSTDHPMVKRLTGMSA